MNPEISIVIRSHNDDRDLERTLEGVRRQRCSRSFEVISVDDGSTDRTGAILEACPELRRIDPPPGAYVPGRTLNAAVQACRGEVVVFNNADAVPLDDDWLERLTAPLFGNRTVAACYANQLPRADAAYLVRKDNLRAFGDGRIAAAWEFFFSLASAAARREELLKNPFSSTLPASEDIDWAVRAVRRGGRLRYVPEARVEHSHDYDRKTLWTRFYREGYAAEKIFGTVPGWFASLGRAGMETLRDWVYLTLHPLGWQEIPEAPFRRLIQKFAFRRGGLAARAERRPRT